jgi:hypothetical protein
VTRWSATVKLKGKGRAYEFVSERRPATDLGPGSIITYSSARGATDSAARLIAQAEARGRVVVQAYVTPERSS